MSADIKRLVLKGFTDEMPYYNKRIEDSIDMYRKGLGKIQVVDRQGNTPDNVHIRAVQKNHEFKFGCNSFMLDEFDSKEKNDKYKEAFKSFFNLAVVPFYWRGLEPTQGELRFAADSKKVYRRPAPDLVLDWCEKNNITAKGHPLLWHLYTPDWLPDNRLELKSLIIKRFEEISCRYADRIKFFDVCNESLTYHRKNAVVNMPLRHIEYAFKLAKQYFPNNKLFINEVTDICWNALADERSPYYMQIENLAYKGYMPDAIGMQYHLFYKKNQLPRYTDTLLSPEYLMHAMDLYGKFNVPLSVSEITVPSYEGEDRDEEMQAQLTEYLYKLWFSGEQVDSIIWWNMVDNTGAINPNDLSWDENIYGGGLLNNDFSKKQSGKVVYNLINKEWMTDIDLEDRNYFTGFYGEYDLHIKCGTRTYTKEINLSKHGRNNFVVTID